MIKEDIKERVCRLVSEHLDMPLKEVEESVRVPFRAYLDKEGKHRCDALDYIELIMAFEEEFYIEVPEADEKKLTTINDTVDYIMAAGGI